MSVNRQRIGGLAAGMIWSLLSGAPAVADDTELFLVDSGQFQYARPNVLLVMDTSGSMGDLITTQIPYDPGTTYSGGCSSSRVYWRSGTGNPPGCGTDRWFDANKLVCQRALTAFTTAGYYTDTMAQFDQNFDQRWESIRYQSKDRLVECQDDRPDPDTGWPGHGDGSSATEVYAKDSPTTDPFTDDPNDEVSWGSSPTDQVYTMYSANYLNWYYGSSTQSTPKIDIVKEVATNLVDTVNGVNIGLMRFNRNSWRWNGNTVDHGGAIVHEVDNVSTARQDLKDAIDALPDDGWTPLAETMYEAALYFSGGAVDYGNLNAPESSVPESRAPAGSNTYKSPIEYSCPANFIVYLTDGEPTRDVSADAKAASLIGGACDANDADGDGDNDADGRCLDDIAEWLYQTDLSPDTDPNGLSGKQNVITHTIGFDIDLPILAETAQVGGGRYFQANDTAELSTALTSIVTEILDTRTTFVSPTVSVNSFNRTRHLNDLYVTMFQPTGEVHWPGNIKKYRLRASDATIVDANGMAAVATTGPTAGFFKPEAQSYWSPAVDGHYVQKGGAANQLPDPADRNVYTCLGCSGATSLTSASNQIVKTNGAIDDAVLDIGQAGDPSRDDLIDFILGVDVTDVDQDPSTTVRNQMGDPLHAQPASVMYDADETVVYFATNDGYLHAIDTKTGVEKWAFIPEEFLPDMADLYVNDSTAFKHYGVDGNLRIQINADDDGTINGSDRVYLFFGMRRGGNVYYGLDVTDPDAPVLLWKLASADLPGGLGQTWSSATPTRINVSGVNSEHLAIVIGTGYDPGHDNSGMPTAPDAGNGIAIVDSVDGDVLWNSYDHLSAVPLSMMNHSLAGDVRVVDLDGDKHGDRLYAADMGGQIWRFDITNGETAANLATGGVIAQLGGSVDPAIAAARRFYYAPDTALVLSGEHNFMHIGIGSGHRAHPNSTDTHDRFYALRDHNPFTPLTQAQFDARAASPVMDSDLQDITNNLTPNLPVGSDGWRLELREGAGSWVGEKVLAEARTFDNKVFFTTFTPGASPSANDCVPRLGTNRLYVVDIFSGAPAQTNYDDPVDPSELDETDRYTEFEGSIASEVVILFPSPDDPDPNDPDPPPPCEGDECQPPPPVYCVNLECRQLGGNAPVRTFWSQESTR